LNDDYLGKNTQGAQALQERIKNDIARYMSKEDIPIDKATVTYTTPLVEQSKTARPPEREEVRKNYNELLARKIQDHNLKDKAIEYAEIMIQPSTFCKLTLKTDKGQDAVLKVICCLPEHAQKMVSWWLHKEIDSNNLPVLAQQFENQMKEDRIAKVHVEKNIGGSAKVTAALPIFSFA